MAEFQYTAMNNKGEMQKGRIEADNKEAAISAMKYKGLSPLKIEKTHKSIKNINVSLGRANKVKSRDIVIFTRQMATMVGAGVPIIRSLSTMKEQSDSQALKKILEDIVAEVEAGTQLSEAMSKYPRVFSSVYVNMVKAGEEGGILDEIMDRLANQVEKDAEIKGKLRSAMVYPGVILTVAIGAVIFLITNIIPKFTVIFDDFETDLPIQTQLMLNLSDFLISYGLVLIVAIVVISIAVMRFVRKPKGKYMLDTLLMKLPAFGTIILKINVARFARTFSSLTGAGISVIEAMKITSGSLSSSVMQKGIEVSITKIKNGQPIAASLAESNIFPAIVTQMAAIGEETGQIDTVLERIAVFYEQEVDRTIASINSIIEPALIVGLGGIVALIIASIFGPLTEITQGF
ncbi:MAG: type II secretion system F family protein [Candidatus Saccharimonadales bacterium]